MSVTAPELETVSVDLGARSYDILVGHGALDQLGPRLAAMLKQKRVFVLTPQGEILQKYRFDERVYFRVYSMTILGDKLIVQTSVGIEEKLVALKGL